MRALPWYHAHTARPLQLDQFVRSFERDFNAGLKTAISPPGSSSGLGGVVFPAVAEADSRVVEGEAVVVADASAYGVRDNDTGSASRVAAGMIERSFVRPSPRLRWWVAAVAGLSLVVCCGASMASDRVPLAPQAGAVVASQAALESLAREGRLTVRALRAFGVHGELIDRLAIALRDSGYDVLAADLQQIERWRDQARSGGDAGLASQGKALQRLAERMASYRQADDPRDLAPLSEIEADTDLLGVDEGLDEDRGEIRVDFDDLPDLPEPDPAALLAELAELAELTEGREAREVVGASPDWARNNIQPLLPEVNLVMPPARLSVPDLQARLDDPCDGLKLAEDEIDALDDHAVDGSQEPPLAEVDPALLTTALARDIGTLTRNQYAASVQAARELLRHHFGVMSPEQTLRFEAAWAAALDFPSRRVIEWLDRVNPLLAEFIALSQATDTLLEAFEEARFEAEMAAAYEDETATRAAMETVGWTVRELQGHRHRLDAVSAAIAALGEPPEPMREKCVAQQRFGRHLATLMPPELVVGPAQGWEEGAIFGRELFAQARIPLDGLEHELVLSRGGGWLTTARGKDGSAVVQVFVEPGVCSSEEALIERISSENSFSRFDPVGEVIGLLPLEIQPAHPGSVERPAFHLAAFNPEEALPELPVAEGFCIVPDEALPDGLLVIWEVRGPGGLPLFSVGELIGRQVREVGQLEAEKSRRVVAALRPGLDAARAAAAAAAAGPASRADAGEGRAPRTRIVADPDREEPETVPQAGAEAVQAWYAAEHEAMQHRHRVELEKAQADYVADQLATMAAVQQANRQAVFVLLRSMQFERFGVEPSALFDRLPLPSESASAVAQNEPPALPPEPTQPEADAEELARAQALLAEKIAFHHHNIEQLNEDMRRIRSWLEQAQQAEDEASLKHNNWMLLGKQADLQRENDAIATLESGNYIRTRTAWDDMAAAQAEAHSRQLAFEVAHSVRLYQSNRRLLALLPAEERSHYEQWTLAQLEGGRSLDDLKRITGVLARQAMAFQAREAAEAEHEAAVHQYVIDVYDNYQYVITGVMYATPFVASGGTLALAYGLTSGALQGYQTGGLLGADYRGGTGMITSAVTTAARYYSPSFDYALTFYEGYSVGGAAGGLENVARTFVYRKAVQLGTQQLLKVQHQWQNQHKQARLDAWRDAKRRHDFTQERAYGKAMVQRHQETYRELRQLKRAGAEPALLRAAENRLMDWTAAIKHAPHAKGYLKFGANVLEQRAYNATSRLHTGRVVQEFRRELRDQGYDVDNLQLRPIRNAGNTSPGMDLDLAVSTRHDPRVMRQQFDGTSVRMDVYSANREWQAAFNKVYAGQSGGRSATHSWQVVTSDAHLEAYHPERGQLSPWIRLGKIQAGGASALDAIDPRYAADAARITEYKAHEIRHQAGLGRDNQNWEILRGTSKDIRTKILPLLAERNRQSLSPEARKATHRSYAYYRQLADAMDVANHDPVGAEKRVHEMTGRHPIDAVHLVTMAIESLGKFK